MKRKKNTEVVDKIDVCPERYISTRQEDLGLKPPLKRLSAVRVNKMIPVPRKKTRRSSKTMLSGISTTPSVLVLPNIDASAIERAETGKNTKSCKYCSHITQATVSSKEDTKHKNNELLSSIQALRTDLSAKNKIIDNAKTEIENYKAVITSMKEEFTCAICKEIFVNAFSLVCSHLFCELCIKEWLNKKQRHDCPICRVRITAQPVCSVILNNVVSKLEEKLSEEELQERTKIKQEHIARLAEIPQVNPRFCVCQASGGDFVEYSSFSDISDFDSDMSSDMDVGEWDDILGTSIDSSSSSNSDDLESSNDVLSSFDNNSQTSDSSSSGASSGSRHHDGRPPSAHSGWDIRASESRVDPPDDPVQDSDPYFTCSENEH